jgi:hypothetical protein
MRMSLGAPRFTRPEAALPKSGATRIVLQARVRFAGVMVRKRWLELGLWLHRRVTHPTLVRVESFGRLGYGHYFRLRTAADLDAALAGLIAEAYAAARQGGGRADTR